MKKLRKPIGKRLEKICEQCKEVYSPFPYKNETSRFCSSKCFHEARRIGVQICQECKAEFRRGKLAKYCGRSCAAKNNTPPPLMTKTGENHPRVRSIMQKMGLESYEEYEASFLREFKLYKRRVWYHTNKQPLHLLENYHKPRTRSGVEGGYQLDHKVSISFGFHNNISAAEIGNIANLRIITWQENRQKSDRCV